MPICSNDCVRHVPVDKQRQPSRPRLGGTRYIEALGDLQGGNLFEIIGYLQKREGVHFEVRAVR